MTESFRNILIPVDFTINTNVAVKRALEFADPGTVIHLLHVQHAYDRRFSFALARNPSYKTSLLGNSDAEEKLLTWKWTIEDSVKKISARTWFIYGQPVQKAIESKGVQIGADLIIIAKSSHHSWFPFLNTVVPSQIVKRTGIPVFTVKPGSLASSIRTIIVPIAGEGPGSKLLAIANICRKFRVKVHLVSFVNRKNEPVDFYPSHLLQAYQFLKQSACTRVQYDVLHGKNKAEALVRYAEKIYADVLLVHPESETRIGWMNKHISDVLPRDSRIQVFTIEANKSFNKS